jgi:hypothetical protein
LLVASLDDLMATKLKATLDRAEAKDYRDIVEMISAGVSLAAGLCAFKRAIGYFGDGDLNTTPPIGTFCVTREIESASCRRCTSSRGL